MSCTLLTRSAVTFNLKCLCYMNGETFKRRLACSVAVTITAYNNFVPLLKVYY